MVNIDVTTALVMVVPMLVAITFHEAAHGYVAYRLGDPTAKQAGRVTFNPLKHIDLVGTIILPFLLMFSGLQFLFGYAKPVPVDFQRLSDKRFGALKVALAGPAINLLLAVSAAILLHLDFLLSKPSEWMRLLETTHLFVIFNLILAVFNMLPILPLDGGRVLHSLLPPWLAVRYARTEKAGMLAVLGLFFFPAVLKNMGLFDLSTTYYLLQVPAEWLYDLVLKIAGIQPGCVSPGLCYPTQS